MRKAVMLAALLLSVWMSSTSYSQTGQTLDDRVREADRRMQQLREMDAMKAQYEEQLSRQRSQYEEQLSHERAVQYLDPYGIDRER